MMNQEQRAARRRLGETELALHRAADASRRAEIARCRAVFEEAYRSKKIYAIEYVYRVSGWGYPDKKGKTRREHGVQRGRTMPYMESIGFVPHSVTPCGVMVAVRDFAASGAGDVLAFGASALDLVDKWNKYIGLEMALRRASSGGATGAGQPTRRFFSDFIQEQSVRLRGDIAKRDHGDRRGIVTTTARGDTRVEMPVIRPMDYMFLGNMGYHHNAQSTGTWLGLKTDPPAQPSPIIAVEPEPAIIKPGQRLDDDALKITATGSVYREVKK